MKKTKEKAVKTAAKPAVKPAKRVSKKSIAAKGVTKASDSKVFVTIDYPIEADVLQRGHYAFRISASPIGAVELSFNGSEWKPCRFASGYWWFDWTNFPKGAHSIEARLLDSKNQEALRTLPRKFDVK